MGSKKLRKQEMLKALLYNCSSIPQVLTLLTSSASLSDKCVALRVAGNILLEQKWVERNEKLVELQMELKNEILHMKNREITNFVHFVRISRESGKFKSEVQFSPKEFLRICEVFKDRSMETSEVIALYYDLKRIKSGFYGIDEYMIQMLENENLSINVNQIKIVMRTVLNSTTIYNPKLIECCIKKILEIEFNKQLSGVVVELVDILFEANFRMNFFESKEIFMKIGKFLKEVKISEFDYLKLLEIHKFYNRDTILLRITIEKFLTELDAGQEFRDPEVFSYILNISPSELSVSPVFVQKFLPACISLLQNHKRFTKHHACILEGLLSFSPLPNSYFLDNIFSEESLKTLCSTLDPLTQAYIFRFYYRKTNTLGNLFSASFSIQSIDNLETVLKIYTILKTADIFKLIPGLELEIIQIIKGKARASFDNSKKFIGFVSRPHSKVVKDGLKEVIIECLPLCLKFYDNDYSIFRSLLALYCESEEWKKMVMECLDKSQNGNSVEFLMDNFVGQDNVEGLMHLWKVSRVKCIFGTVSILGLLMHPCMWVI